MVSLFGYKNDRFKKHSNSNLACFHNRIYPGLNRIRGIVSSTSSDVGAGSISDNKSSKNGVKNELKSSSIPDRPLKEKLMRQSLRPTVSERKENDGAATGEISDKSEGRADDVSLLAIHSISSAFGCSFKMILGNSNGILMN